MEPPFVEKNKWAMPRAGLASRAFDSIVEQTLCPEIRFSHVASRYSILVSEMNVPEPKPISVKSVVSDPQLVEKRRAQIIKAATQLFASRGFHGTKVKDIADAANVSAGLIYQYFEEKHDILFLAITRVVAEKIERLQAAIETHSDAEDRLREVIKEYIRINDEHHYAVILIYREVQCLPRASIRELQLMEVRTNALIAEAVESGIASGAFKAVSADFVSHAIVALAQSWATKYWRLKEKGGLDRYIDSTTNLVLDAIRRRAES